MADVELTIVIPEAYIAIASNAFLTLADTHMTIEARGSGDPETEFNGHWDFRIQPKGDTETLKAFGERFLRELGKACINMVDKAEDEIRYRTKIAEVVPPASDVPDNILT